MEARTWTHAGHTFNAEKLAWCKDNGISFHTTFTDNHGFNGPNGGCTYFHNEDYYRITKVTGRDSHNMREYSVTKVKTIKEAMLLVR